MAVFAWTLTLKRLMYSFKTCFFELNDLKEISHSFAISLPLEFLETCNSFEDSRSLERSQNHIVIANMVYECKHLSPWFTAECRSVMILHSLRSWDGYF